MNNGGYKKVCGAVLCVVLLAMAVNVITDTTTAGTVFGDTADLLISLVLILGFCGIAYYLLSA